MNKKEADEFVARVTCDLIERHVMQVKGPIAYDFAFGEGVEGLKMSEKDTEKVEDAFVRLQNRLSEKGHAFIGDPKAPRSTFRQPKPAGKPGRRVKNYGGYL